MALFGPSFPGVPFTELDADYDRNDIGIFVDDFTFSEDAISEYKKTNRLEDIFERTSTGAFAIAVLSLIALILIPLFSVIAEVILSEFSIPAPLSNYITDEAGLQTGTLIIVGATFIASLLIGSGANRISNTFRSYKQNTGISEFALNAQELAKAYKCFENGDYEEGRNHLLNYESLSMFQVERYSNSIKINGQIDQDYIEETYEDFTSLFIARLYSHNNDSPDTLELIANRYDSDYYCEENQITKKENTEEYVDSYPGIIIKAIKNLVGSASDRITSIVTEKPWTIHLILLAIGIGLSRVSATLAVITATVLTAGFESWRRSKYSENIESETLKEK